MNNTLFLGFKGKNNTSCMLAEQLSPKHLLLTNSFTGLKKDIDSISGEYNQIVMFGVDKELSTAVRIERVAAKNGIKFFSKLDLEKLAEAINCAGIPTIISEKPTAYLCNEAYWNILEKFNGRAVFIHVPTIKHVDESFAQTMKKAKLTEI